MGPPPPDGELRFEPPPGSLSVAADDTVRFRAVSPTGVPLSGSFVVDGQPAGPQDVLVFVPDRLGSFEVRVTVTFDGTEHTATWSLDVRDEGVQPTPNVFELAAQPGEDPGSVDVVWERPPPSLIDVPIDSYEIAAHTAPFGDAEFAQYVVATVADVPAVLRQRATLQGLTERVFHTVAVRAVDRVGRVSNLRSVVSDVTGQFAWSGEVYRFSRLPGTPVAPLPGVVVDVAGHRVSTNGLGLFTLSGIADLSDVPLLMNEQSGATYYEIDTGPLPPEDASFRVMMLPRGLVQLPGSTLVEVERLRFLKILREIDVANASELFPTWASYPVKVYVHPYFQDARDREIPAGSGRFGDLVDYRLAFQRGIDAWNTEAGVALLELVDIDQPLTADQYSSTTGVFYDPILSSGSSILGKVWNVRPPTNGTLYRDVPELQRMQLLSEFNFQRVADWVVAHELGHVLGLSHSPGQGHLMYQTVATVTEGSGRPHPEEALIARLLCDLSEITPQMRSGWWAVPE